MAERLTMQEVIEHCERAVIQAEMLRFTDTKQYMEHKQVREWLEELQHYKDLEEQGKLIELPCAVEDIVYAADAEPIIPLMVSKIGVYLDGEYGGDWESLSSFGKTIFLTPEAAEAALKGAEQ